MTPILRIITDCSTFTMSLIHQELTDIILRCFYAVYNRLGYGFLEKVYENAMLHELRKNELYCEKQVPIKVTYDGVIVGDYYADLVVENLVIIELKASEVLAEEHELQLLNYLKATDKEIGLLLNFGKKPTFKRKIFTNDKKSV